MINKIILVLLLMPLMAFGQTYPSPTFSSITLQNPLTVTNGGTGVTGSTGSGLVVLSASPTLSGATLSNPIITGTSTIPYSITLNNPSATTVSGKLNQIINMTDFSPYCNGSTNDDVAVSLAITDIGSTPTTLLISCPLKIAANHAFSVNTQLEFEANGEIIGTSGSEVIQVQQQILAGRTQIFSNLVPQADIGMTDEPEWFGGNQTVSDASSGFNLAYTFLENVGGVISMAPGSYSLQNPINNVKPHVALIGAGQNATQLNVTAANTNGIVIPGVLGTPVANPTFSGFNLSSTTPGTSNVGIASHFTALPKYADIQVNNFFIGVDMECSTNSFFERMGVAYTSSTNGIIGWNINGGGGCVGGNESSTWRDTYVSGTGAYSGPTGQIGYKAYGAYVNDLYFSNAATAETNYGWSLDYSTAATGGYADVTIHNPVVDGFTEQAILVNALPAQQMLTISDGWLNPVSMLAETDGIYLNSTIGSVQVNGIQIGGEANYAYAVGVKSVSSQNVKIAGSAFNDNKYAIEETGSTGNVYSGNSISNTSAHAAAVDIYMTGSTSSTAVNNTLSGYSSYGASIDVSSTGVALLNNVIQGSNITTPILNSGANPIGGGYTGTGLSVLATSPTIATPTLNGVTNGSTAGSGVIGQISTATTSGTAITSGNTINATSISLAAGSWICWGQALYIPTSGTVIANYAAGITTTSVTLPGSPATAYRGVTNIVSDASSIETFMVPENLSSTTTIYLAAFAGSVTGSTATVNGYLDCLRIH